MQRTSLDIAGSGRGDENRLDDVLLKPTDSKSRETLTFLWEKLEFNFSSGGANETDPTAVVPSLTLFAHGGRLVQFRSRRTRP